MSKLGPLPPISDTSLPDGVSKEQWEQSFKECLKGGTTPFPDASLTALSQVAGSSSGGGASEQQQRVDPEGGQKGERPNREVEN
mmetsp:Transcript_45615/g.83530  ORF Transcript_45615/g.83530 Transcript_45615/m.83530 type:complete len:84 (-) Transcript_45615:35-286(-)